MNDQLTIGGLAEAAEVNVETIRYYQRRGLLDEPDKPIGGQRRYSPPMQPAWPSSSARSSLASR